MLSFQAPSLLILSVSTRLLGILLLALGIAFWLLGVDRRAGVVFDAKGLLLNLGDSTSFIAWENIERVGVSGYRSRLLAIGSRQQLGIVLRDTSAYIQSYEERLPAAQGVFSAALRRLAWLLRRFRRENDKTIAMELAQNRSKSGYDILIPEIFLGEHADSFVRLVEACRADVLERRAKQMAWAQ